MQTKSRLAIHLSEDGICIAIIGEKNLRKLMKEHKNANYCS